MKISADTAPLAPAPKSWVPSNTAQIFIGLLLGILIGYLWPSYDVNGTHVSLTLTTGRGGSSPAVVLAMSKSAPRNLTVSCDYAQLAECRTYPEADLAADLNDPVAAMMTWGAIKADYR